MRCLKSSILTAIIPYLIAISALASCSMIGPYVEVDVRSYSDPTKINELAQLKNFSLTSAYPSNLLLEKELLYLLKNMLVSKGYVYNEEHPDFFVSVNFIIDTVQIQETELVTVHTPGPISRKTGLIGTDKSTYYGEITTEPEQTDIIPIERTIIGYHKLITVYFESPKGAPLWKGEVESTDRTSDLLVVAPTLLDELLAEFPYKTGKKNPRHRRLVE